MGEGIKFSERAALEVLARRKMATIGVLAGDLGIPASTAVTVTGRLLKKGLIFRRERPEGGRGRPSYVYGLRPSPNCVAMQWDGTQLAAAVFSEDARALAVQTVQVPLVKSLAQAAALARDLVDALTIRAGLPRQGLKELAIWLNAIPAPKSGLYSSVLPWVKGNVAQAFSDETGLAARLVLQPTMLAEFRLVGEGDPSSLAYLHAGDGVSGRFTTDHRIFRGHSRWAGQLGHMIVDPKGQRCGCGRRGCLETVCSGPAIARLARKRATGPKAPPWLKELARVGSVRRVVDRLWQQWNAGEAAAIEIMQQPLQQLGWAVGLLVNMLDPELIVVGGYLLEGRDAWIEEVRRRSVPWVVYGSSRDIRMRSAVAAKIEDVLLAIALSYDEASTNSHPAR